MAASLAPYLTSGWTSDNAVVFADTGRAFLQGYIHSPGAGIAQGAVFADLPDTYNPPFEGRGVAWTAGGVALPVVITTDARLIFTDSVSGTQQVRVFLEDINWLLRHSGVIDAPPGEVTSGEAASGVIR